jgi:deoxyribonuclease V
MARPKNVLGLDASYRGTGAYAAGVLWDLEGGRAIETRTAEAKVDFPYVPTYLGFREIPVFGGLMDMAGEGTVLMLDGNGILHPFGFGLACHIGVEYGLPSIGVAKTLLCGNVDANCCKDFGSATPVRLDGKQVGAELRTSARGKPVYVSPGNLTSMPSAVKTTARASRLKIPEPLRLAHLAAAEARRVGA